MRCSRLLGQDVLRKPAHEVADGAVQRGEDAQLHLCGCHNGRQVGGLVAFRRWLRVRLVPQLLQQVLGGALIARQLLLGGQLVKVCGFHVLHNKLQQKCRQQQVCG
jgi:hypothetical protein